jgi:acetyltransferase-like isoleucine patch superfamily enzyme
MKLKVSKKNGGNRRKPKNGYFQHPSAIVEENVTIGSGTNIWAFVHILPGAVIGVDCNICDQIFIEGKVRIGNRVTVKSGVSLWDGLVVENDVFIGPNAVFTNDLRPRSQAHLEAYPQTLLKEGSTLGANCVILPGLTVGRWAMVGAGAVVTHDVPDFGLVVGVPARLRGWVCRCGKKLTSPAVSCWICNCGRTYEEEVPGKLRESPPALIVDPKRETQISARISL